MKFPDEAFDDVELLDLLRCADWNFDNMEHMIPGLPAVPVWILARAQLTGAIRQLEKKP